MPRLLVLFLAVLLISCSSPKLDLPAIADPEALVSDRTPLLLATDIDREVDPMKWPGSIRKLHPVAVEKRDDMIVIKTFAKDGAGARGYIVSHSKPEDKHFTITPTANEDIYQFETAP